MIPAIGIMIGTYIFTRLLALMVQPNTFYSSSGTRVAIILFGILSMVVTAFVCLFLIFTNSKV